MTSSPATPAPRSTREAATATPRGSAARRDAWPEPIAPVRFILDVGAVLDLEIRKLRHDPLELMTRAVQPVLWLLIFGKVIAHLRAIPTGSTGYLDFLTPGILAQSALFVSIFYGIAIIWERDLGILHKFLVSPASRLSLVLGKAFSAGIRALTQAVVVAAIALAVGVHIRFAPQALLGVAVAVVAGAACFAILSLIVASLVRTRERFMGIGQLLTMPLFFASNAIYPIAIMPGWLRSVARLNPLTYQVDALRALLVPGNVVTYGLGEDFAVLFLTLTVLALIAARLYPRVAR
ncbi:MAG: multidrug ABC transporter permease [Actinobacteria bacterium]|nr:MAG: multidrug ABC transporter permease [Actinomycetota bacterium]